ncbi:PREDICTED: tRNA methyltransferase 10 homolog B isoform X1 [Gavialis gangeticus]|uniref:tRNA methyltransferase 10 homolog B isoform X1 n=2 Tax=Gavialis gangeticus TaxID=94835 RepID=UPI00092FD7A3|nr:PREDICTED: tRNA methyltransferase 10 homolog B isoform X1 [Gavialis gangeticus]
MRFPVCLPGCSRPGSQKAGQREKIKHAELETEHSDSMATLDQDWECGAICPGDGGHDEDVCESLSLLQINTGWDSPKDLPVGCEMWSSRNVLRKQRHWERTVTAKKNKRKQERERRKAKHGEDKGSAEQHSKRVLKAITRERLLEAKECGPRLCVDLSMTRHMSRKEVSRLAAQIRRLYGSNKKAEKPFWICLTGFVPGSLVYDECFRMNDGFSNYLMDTTQESYLDLFPLETIVFLTPDSENVLQDVDSSKVYILGGLVDESIRKKLTLRKAQEHSLQTARLPIREYMVKNVNEKNYHSEILAINQVFDALSTYYETKSWPEALKAGVPLGKGYILPDADK